MSKEKALIKSVAKPFNWQECKESIQKATLIGPISITSTFFVADRPLAIATKAASELHVRPKPLKWFVKQASQGNFSACLKSSQYVGAYRTAWLHPFKGYPVALLNSCVKTSVFFPLKYLVERGISALSSNETLAKNYGGFLAGNLAVYITTPFSVMKARLMTDVPTNNLPLRRLMSGVNAIALRDGLQFGIYFNTVDAFKANFGNNFVAAGLAGVVGYIVSNPFSVVGLNQKTSPTSINMLNMGKQIYKASGAKGFYPLMALSALGMFNRSGAIHLGEVVYNNVFKKEPSSC